MTKQVKNRRCRAKNPDLCPYHGKKARAIREGDAEAYLEARLGEEKPTPTEVSIPEDVEERRELASDEFTDPEVLSRLAEDEDEDVREAVALNLSTPLETVVSLTENADGYNSYGVDPDKFDENSGFDEHGRNRYGARANGFYISPGFSRAIDVSPEFRDADGYDENGYNEYGDDRDGNSGKYIPVSECVYDEFGKHKGSGEYDKNGYRWDGFDSDGVHATTGDDYNEYGYDRNGYNRSGWYEPQDRNEDILAIISSNKFTGTRYAPDGYDAFGFDKNGIHRNGTRFAPDGLDRDGFHEDGWEHYYGGALHKKTGTPFDPDGYDVDGYDKNGFGRDGYNKDGRDPQGFDSHGKDKDGYNKSGYNDSGFNRKHLNRQTGTLFDPDGYNEYGYDKNGFGQDGRGFRGLKKGELVRGFRTVYRSKDTTARDGWVFVGGHYIAERNKVGAKAFINKKTGTQYDPDGFDVVGVNANQITQTGFDLKTKLNVETGTEFDRNGWNWNRSSRLIPSAWIDR